MPAPPLPPEASTSSALSAASNRSASAASSVGEPRGESGRRLDATVGWEIVDFTEIQPVPCPCGWARRAFAEVADFPGTIHVTEISQDARLHYHRSMTETYFILDCDEHARIQLNDEQIPVRAGMCVLIRPGVRHRALGAMRVLIIAIPKFDPADEWFDETPAQSLGQSRSAPPRRTWDHAAKQEEMDI